MKRLLLAGPLFAIGAGIAAITALGLGGSINRTEAYIWPAAVIIWSLLVLAAENKAQRRQEALELQATVIKDQAEFITQIAQKHSR